MWPDGTITTIAGNGRVNGPLGDGGPATAAPLSDIQGIARRGDGSLLIADSSHFRIRQVSLDGTITTVAGDGREGNDLLQALPSGMPAVQTPLGFTYGVDVTPDGGFLFADAGQGRIHRVDATGIETQQRGASPRETSPTAHRQLRTGSSSPPMSPKPTKTDSSSRPAAARSMG